MDLRSIAKNENFIPIFIKTTEKYYLDVLKQPNTILETPRKGATCLYINFLPSFVASFPVKNGAKELLYGEYNIRGCKLKYWAGKALVFFSLTSGGMFAWKKLWMVSNEGYIRNFYCLPGNRTNRYFDFDNGLVDCVTKSGYDTSLMEKQLKFRKKYRYPFVPDVVAQGDYWYREHIMSGYALARMTNQIKYEKAREEAIHCLGLLVKDTMMIYTPKSYIKLLNEQLEAIFVKIGTDITVSIKESAELIIHKLELWLKQFPMDVPISMSHGDFQEGNIWVNLNCSVTIYDWETNGLRSVWYDLVTLLMNLRNTIGSGTLRNYILNSDEYLVFDSRKNYLSQEKETILRIISTEDFLFQLIEYSQRLFDRNKEKLREIICKYQKILEK